MQSDDVVESPGASHRAIEAFVPVPLRGRTFSSRRSARLGDVTPKGRLRLDAVACYLQDIANDDAIDAGLENAMAWVVRRCEIRVHQFPSFRDTVELVTFCGGYGSRWAQRRTNLASPSGLAMEAATLWVSIDPVSGRPARLPDAFVELYGEAAAGRKVGARMQLGDPSDAVLSSASSFSLRFADFDLLGHVNNSFAWVIVEEWLSNRGDLRAPLRVEVEHRAALERHCSLGVAVQERGDGLDLWLVDQAAGSVLVAVRVGKVSASTS